MSGMRGSWTQELDLEAEHEQSEGGSKRHDDSEKRVGDEQDELCSLPVHIILDDDLHTETHMHGDGEEEQQQDHRHQR